ncbi:hypothetical protein [Jiella mangrovi]|uniref:Uncharacterized protein n=1 Tax=Jiella mangrovi TaxID=2821407 RepID=A0ABS4BFS2_9HYPH|nr:hypothetical protein [Jiella mangrovi]MBP0615609.1 hypothetical protein [Jiella mangrovi]
MLYLVSGSHSAYSRFGFSMVQAIGRAAHGDVQPAQFSRLEQFYDAYKDRKTDAFVAFIHAGDNRVAKLLQRTQSKVVLFDDDLSQTVGRMLTDPNKEFRKVLCSATMASATLSYLAETTNAMVYPRPDTNSLLLPFIQSLAWFFGIEPDQALVDTVVARLKLGAITPRTTIIEGMNAFASDYKDAQAAIDALNDDEIALLGAVREAYGVGRGQIEGGTISWPIQSLFDPRNRQEPAPEYIELLGKARRLLNGPEYRLVPGNWLCEVVIRVSDNPSKNRLIWLISELDKRRGMLSCDLPTEGRLALTQEFTVESAANPITFAFDMKEGAIEGVFSVETIRLRRVKAAPLE